MKLLTKSQVENKKKKEQEALFRQGQQMKQFVEQARLELNNMKAQKERETIKIEAAFDKTFEQLANKRMELEREIKELETKRDGLRTQTIRG